MIAFLELLLQIITTIAYGVLIWVLWPVLSALVAALNAIGHFFNH